jgi:sarcosine oxidase, subunit beta
MAERADVIVVGAGVFGTSVALHLVQEGAGDVVLLERDGVGQATSAAGAGFVDPWAAGSNPNLGPEELAIEEYGLAFYASLTERDPQVAYLPNGCLWLAVDAAQLQRLAPILDYPAIPTQLLEPEDVAELTEVVRPEAIVGGIFHPRSGQVSAPGAARAIAAAFAADGGRLRVRSPVLRLLVEDATVRGVETEHGRILSDRVVLAVGAWTNRLLSAYGVFLPMVPLVVSRIVTEPLGIPRSTPPLFIPGVAEGEDATGYLYARGDGGRLLWGAHYAAPPRTAFVDRPLMERFDQLPLDGIDELRRAATRAAASVPALGRYTSVTVAHGAPCFTPDNRSLVGPVDEIGGLFVLAGCNEMGVTHAPGFGRALAERIVHGAGRLASIEPLRPGRFGDSLGTEGDVLALVDA